jgi:hypothetical protein
MPETSSIPGLRDLWRLTLGDPRVCVAVLDGPAVLDHPCLSRANVRGVRSYWLDEAADVEDGLVEHATHVCSVLFSPHDSDVLGLAPRCRGLSIPVQTEGMTNAYNVVRALDAARDAGADIIHVAFVQPTQSGTAENLLERAVQTCLDEGILVVSPAGNDRGECWTMPSAIAGVLAVGAMKDDGRPFRFSNYGGILQSQGVLAPGENILGADSTNGGTWRKKGTSCAAPIVTGVAALLMSLQLRQGRKPSAAEVRQAILDTAIPCDPREVDEPERCLRGKLNIPGATETIIGSAPAHRPGPGRRATVSVTPRGEARSGDRTRATPAPPGPPDTRTRAVATGRAVRTAGMPVETENPVSPAKKRLIYALGTIGYDFGTESRRDTFEQLMPPVEIGATTVPANPYDPRQMSDYLARNPSEGRSLVWTLHQEQTPVYALKPVGSFGHQVYETLRLLLARQVDVSESGASVERVSVPAERIERALRLFSGQVVPVVKLRVARGLYGWRVDDVIEDALAAAAPRLGGDEALRVHRALRGFLDRVYHDLKSPGDTSKDRALNFAATNAFQVTEAFALAVSEGRQLKSIEVVKSPVCRLYSDCWDVKLKFFDPDHGQRAKRVCRLTVDVSDLMPVTLGEVRTWMTRD